MKTLKTLILQNILDALKMVTNDFRGLLEIVELLREGEMKKAIHEIRYLDTVVRDECVKYFDEDALYQVEMEGQGKRTGHRHTNKELAEKVELAILSYVSDNLNWIKKELREYRNA